MYLGEAAIKTGFQLPGQSISLTRTKTSTKDFKDDVPRNVPETCTIRGTVGSLKERDREFLGGEYATYDLIRVSTDKDADVAYDDTFSYNGKTHRVIKILTHLAHKTFFAKVE